MYKLTPEDLITLNDYINLIDIFLDVTACVEQSVEDLCNQANVLSLNDYARRTRRAGHYTVPNHHNYMLGNIRAVMAPLADSIKYYRLFKERFGEQYSNRPIPLKARAYLEQQILNEHVSNTIRELHHIKTMYRDDPFFDEAVRHAEQAVTVAKSTVIRHTDPASGYIFYGKEPKERSDHQIEANSVGIHQFITSSEKKS